MQVKASYFITVFLDKTLTDYLDKPGILKKNILKSEIIRQNETECKWEKVKTSLLPSCLELGTVRASHGRNTPLWR